MEGNRRVPDATRGPYFRMIDYYKNFLIKHDQINFVWYHLFTPFNNEEMGSLKT